MADIGRHHTVSNAIAAEIVGDEAPRSVSQSLQQSGEETLGSRAVSPLPDQDVMNHAMLVYSAPKII
jgi:hypothetical protein